MTKSANQIAQETFERDRAESRMHWLHKAFAEKYAPDDIPSRDVFYADLAIMIREAQMDALRPFQDAAARQIAMQPIPPVVLNLADDTTEGTSDE